jgi:alanyl-tRNA synthetase
MANGELVPLPNKHVDTGMGFERLVRVIQKKSSNYDSDVFTPIINKIAELSGFEYGKNEELDIAMRVVADHVRTIAFSITDGQLPSNNKAGYVIRRILRRAVRYSYTFLNSKTAFVYKLVDTLIATMGNAYPELSAQKTLIEKVIKEEEESFLRTLSTGINMLDKIIAETKAKNYNVVNGAVAFELYDTFGFPLDLTELILKENGLVVNREEFEQEMQKQKDRARNASAVETDDWVVLQHDDREEFIGYDYLESEVFITRYRKIKQKNKELYQIVFNITPFYAESGGQVGDTGYIQNGDEKVSIIDTKKENNLIVHLAKQLPSELSANFKAVVNTEARQNTANNHTATH